MKVGFIYIMTNKNYTTLYTGVTSNLPKRIQQHKEAYYSQSFTSRYKLYTCVLGGLSGNRRCYCQGKTNKSMIKTEET